MNKGWDLPSPSCCMFHVPTTSQGTSRNTCWIAAETSNEIWTEIALALRDAELLVGLLARWLHDLSHRRFILFPPKSRTFSHHNWLIDVVSGTIMLKVPFWPFFPCFSMLQSVQTLSRTIWINMWDQITYLLRRIYGWVCRYTYLMSSSVQKLVRSYLQSPICFKVCLDSRDHQSSGPTGIPANLPRTCAHSAGRDRPVTGLPGAPGERHKHFTSAGTGPTGWGPRHGPPLWRRW